MGHAPSGRISNRYRYLTFEELKWDILILQGFKSAKVYKIEDIFYS